MESSEQFAAEVERRREQTADAHADLIGDLAHRRAMERISAAMPALTNEQIAARDREIAERDAQREQQARVDRWRAFIRDRGERYSDCRLNNFDQSHDAQKRAVADLTDYCRNVTDRIADGDGVVLFGPKGTGKDHLIVALCRQAILSGQRVVWQNGMDLFGDIRDAMDGGEAERALVHRLVSPDVLYLSDPLPPVGNLSEFQASMLFRILDGRYSRRRPLWVTVNVASGSELDVRMGPQNGDRIRDGATAIHCDWPSYRRARE
jgi:DNA replication protein DnaC